MIIVRHNSVDTLIEDFQDSGSNHIRCDVTHEEMDEYGTSSRVVFRSGFMHDYCLYVCEIDCGCDVGSEQTGTQAANEIVNILEASVGDKEIRGGYYEVV